MNEFNLDSMTKKQILHKMKSPLTSINGYAQLIAAKLQKEDLDPKLIEWFANIRNDVKKLIEMVEKVERLEES